MGSRDRALSDPGPATGAWDPFSFDDEDDEVGPATVVDGRRRGQNGTPRRAPVTPPRGGVPRGAEPTPPEAAGRRGAAPATAFDATGGRPVDGPATQVDVAGPRGDGPATEFDVTGARSGSAPVAPFGPTGGGRDDGPATDFAPPGRGRRRAAGRPGFGSGLRTGRSGRTGATPATAFNGPAPAPSRAFPGPGPSGRVAPPPRRVVEEPTELTGRDGIDERTDFAPSRRDGFAAPDDDDADRFADAFGGGREYDRDSRGVDDRDLDDRHLDDRDLDDRDLDDPALDDRDLEVGDLDDQDVEDRDLEDSDLDDLDDLDDELDHRTSRPAQAWAGVVAQWLAGAIAGAVLWVLFRYLWRGLPVVALAAALLVTAGLVLLVRQLLHDVDRRTTAFAVLVGLLLTASPAVLVLLGR